MISEPVYSRRKQTKTFEFKNKTNLNFDEWIKKNANEWWVVQKNWICDNGGNCLIDYIGKYEKINECFTKICKICKINTNHKLAHTNSSQHKHYSLYYSKKQNN